MFGEKAAIRKYIEKLPNALTKNYGGGRPYTVGQVKTTVAELGLNQKYMNYAYLMFCSTETLESIKINDSEIDLMSKLLEKVTSGGGIVTSPIDAFFGLGDGDGGGFGDGGGGGE